MTITDTMRLDRLLKEPISTMNLVVEVNRYGKGATGNPVVSIEPREDIDAVITSEREHKGTYEQRD